MVDKNSEDKRPNISLISPRGWKYLQRHYHLSRRELQVAGLICRGFTNARIAEKINISTGTVKTHLRNVYRRIRVNRRLLMLLRFLEDLEGLKL